MKLPDNISELVPYAPIEGCFTVRLDANEAESLELDGKWLEQLEEFEINRYPDPGATKLCKAFARFINVDEKFIVCGNGSDELIGLIINSFVGDNEKVLISTPDFSMYKIYTEMRRAKVVEVPKNADYKTDTEAVIKAVHESKPKVLIFSNPCNPTGTVITREECRKIIKAAAAENTLVVLDEAYGEFAEGVSLLGEVAEYDNLIILKTLSKIGAAGLRIGFSVSNQELAGVMNGIRSPYNVNSVSQILGEKFIYYMSDNGRLLLTVAQRDKVFKVLAARKTVLGAPFKTIESHTNFIYCVSEKAETIAKLLEGDGISVRVFKNALRISIGSIKDNDTFIEAFNSIRTL
ncbi:MAG: aminotransferase class I/II-fold pyridoxal phosphate-dependent enzyme [Christensenellaceae bacterium]|jgi:histidinol-phosphate aminotransferase|nr:aminotransferase class I/II-fold pyridoxal phosphate-dependent enzyme [Christensenellaceae bacterium]